MPSGEGVWLSRVRENLTHGSLGERWRRGRSVGHLRAPGRWLGNATLMAWSGPIRRSAATAPALYPTWLWRDRVTYSLLDRCFLVRGAYYLTEVLHAPGVTAMVTSSMAGKG